MACTVVHCCAVGADSVRTDDLGQETSKGGLLLRATQAISMAPARRFAGVTTHAESAVVEHAHGVR